MRALRCVLTLGAWLLLTDYYKSVAAEPLEATAAADDPLPGHSVHGAAFDEGPRQGAVLLDGCGKVRFMVTTKHELAARFFEQGLAQLHGFWYFEAERSFRQAAAIDPNLAMAYWGMAWANINNETRARAFARAGAERRSHASPREALWIDATAEYFREEKTNVQAKVETAEANDKPASTASKRSDTERRRAYIKRLEAICFESPDDIEARALLAVFLWQSRDKGLAIVSHTAVDALIDQVLAVEPNHPAHHYRIHLWDDERAERALKSAALCGPAAPGVAHMWHMPGHTYAKLHRYADAAWQQEAAGRVDHAYMARFRILPGEIHNYAHNQEWLIRTLGLQGRAHEALGLAKNLIEIPRHPKWNKLDKSGSAAAFGRQRLVELLQRFELWDEAIALAATPYLDASGSRRDQARRNRLLAAAYGSQGNTALGNAQTEALEELLAAAQREQTAAAEQAAEKELAAKKDRESDAARDKRIEQARHDAKKKFQKEVDELEQASAEARGHAALANRDYPAAVKALEQAKVSQELLSRAHLSAGDTVKAEEVARKAAASDDQQFYPWANLADILYRAGKPDEAANALGKLRTAGANADLNLAVVRRLTPLLAEHDLTNNWRRSRAAPADVGTRPPLKSLGPVHWQPVTAPEFQLPTVDGREIALADYRGRPVLVIFYLGHGCLHCVKQLQAFGPVADKFRAAGIELLAVSTDSVAELEKSLSVVASEGGFPIPLLANPSLTTFRAWRAYDDFERAPLHNTTLLDSRGRILWQEISAEPFMDAAFLLDEAVRLVKLHDTPRPQVVHQPVR